MADQDQHAAQILRLLEGLVQRGITVAVTGGTPIAESAVDATLAHIDRVNAAHGHLCGDCKANVRGALEADRA